MRSLTRTVLEAAGSGFAGAVTVAALNEGMRRRKINVPQLQIIGMRATRKASRFAGMGRPSRKAQYGATLGLGLLDATLFYSAVRIGRYPRPIMRGAVLGGLAGLSAIYLPPLFGLGEAPVSFTPRMKRMTFGYYMAGGLVAGLVGRAFAESRAMTEHPIRTFKRRWGRQPEVGEPTVRQTEEARF